MMAYISGIDRAERCSQACKSMKAFGPENCGLALYVAFVTMASSTLSDLSAHVGTKLFYKLPTASSQGILLRE